MTAAPTASAAERVTRPHGYEHLAPLFVERDTLATVIRTGPGCATS